MAFNLEKPPTQQTEQKWVTCPKCNGTGKEKDGSICPKCGGTGRVIERNA